MISILCLKLYLAYSSLQSFGLTEFSLVSGNITPGANTHNTSGNDGGMSSDCSDDEGSPGGPGGGNVQIYPWMKKIHVAGAGKEK